MGDCGLILIHEQYHHFKEHVSYLMDATSCLAFPSLLQPRYLLFQSQSTPTSHCCMFYSIFMPLADCVFAIPHLPYFVIHSNPSKSTKSLICIVASILAPPLHQITNPASLTILLHILPTPSYYLQAFPTNLLCLSATKSFHIPTFTTHLLLQKYPKVYLYSSSAPLSSFKP